ncbi:hypothetical protein EI94DRAFT_1713277 [Lactarius quietus]|nr:hypothetical protein EI94DRAFT_1713277 [Lactarius quietus]
MSDPALVWCLVSRVASCFALFSVLPSLDLQPHTVCTGSTARSSCSPCRRYCEDEIAALLNTRAFVRTIHLDKRRRNISSLGDVLVQRLYPI